MTWGQPEAASTAANEPLENVDMAGFPALGSAAPHMTPKPVLSFTQALKTEPPAQPAEIIPSPQPPPLRQPIDSGIFSVLVAPSVEPLHSQHSAPVKILVIDANAIIRGAQPRADELVTIPEVIEELKDQTSRRALPLNLRLEEPSPESLKEGTYHCFYDFGVES